MYTLYKLIFSDGKLYIGQTARAMRTRMTEHRYHSRASKNQVYVAWRDQGEPDFEIISQHETEGEAHAAEKSAIRDLDTLYPAGYNVSRGGKQPDVQWTDEMRNSASARSKQRWEKRKEDGWVMPESQRVKLVGRVFSVEARAKMSAASKGKPKAERSAETKAKLSASAKAMWSDHDRAKARSLLIRSSWTNEKRAKLSEKAAELWKNQEIRAKRLDAMRKSKISNE